MALLFLDEVRLSWRHDGLDLTGGFRCGFEQGIHRPDRDPQKATDPHGGNFTALRCCIRRAARHAKITLPSLGNANRKGGYISHRAFSC